MTARYLVKVRTLIRESLRGNVLRWTRWETGTALSDAAAAQAEADKIAAVLARQGAIAQVMVFYRGRKVRPGTE